jgi:hypothetical protein
MPVIQEQAKHYLKALKGGQFLRPPVPGRETPPGVTSPSNILKDMVTESLFAPTKRKCIVFVAVVALQFIAAAVGVGCGWSLIHGADVLLAGACLVIAGFLILPSAALSSGFVPTLPLPHALFVALSVTLNAFWAWLLVCGATRLQERWRARR